MWSHWPPGATSPRPEPHSTGVIGVDAEAYPIDAGGALRYQPAFAALPPRHPLPPPLPVGALREHLDRNPGRYAVDWTDRQPAASHSGQATGFR